MAQDNNPHSETGPAKNFRAKAANAERIRAMARQNRRRISPFLFYRIPMPPRGTDSMDKTSSVPEFNPPRLAILISAAASAGVIILRNKAIFTASTK